MCHPDHEPFQSLGRPPIHAAGSNPDNVPAAPDDRMFRSGLPDLDPVLRRRPRSFWCVKRCLICRRFARSRHCMHEPLQLGLGTRPHLVRTLRTFSTAHADLKWATLPSGEPRPTLCMARGDDRNVAVAIVRTHGALMTKALARRVLAFRGVCREKPW